MNRSTLLRLIVLVAVSSSAALQAEKKDVWPKPKPTTHDYKKWESNIAAFEAADKKSPPAKGSLLFVGSSTIVRWKTLAEDFAGVPVLNRGFGGNQIKDSTFYAERMIFPYAPKAIFLRAGGNDHMRCSFSGVRVRAAHVGNGNMVFQTQLPLSGGRAFLHALDFMQAHEKNVVVA
jgi:hypothetical protein